MGMYEFWLCFIPLFVAVDIVGVLPIFVALTEGLDEPRVRRVIIDSIVTALAVAIAFLALGPVLLKFLGINVSDFMIAGGLLLLVISLNDILTGPKMQREVDIESIGAVPIGVPLITGPAVLTTCMLLATTYGKPLTALAVTVNVLLVGLTFYFANPIMRRLGRTGLFLAAIAIMLMRKGILETIKLGL
jgi:multiple antibiotic resistance protein